MIRIRRVRAPDRQIGRRMCVRENNGTMAGRPRTRCSAPASVQLHRLLIIQAPAHAVGQTGPRQVDRQNIPALVGAVACAKKQGAKAGARPFAGRVEPAWVTNDRACIRGVKLGTPPCRVLVAGRPLGRDLSPHNQAVTPPRSGHEHAIAAGGGKVQPPDPVKVTGVLTPVRSAAKDCHQRFTGQVSLGDRLCASGWTGRS